jgi:hypothetical protein
VDKAKYAMTGQFQVFGAVTIDQVVQAIKAARRSLM